MSGHTVKAASTLPSTCPATAPRQQDTGHTWGQYQTITSFVNMLHCTCILHHLPVPVPVQGERRGPQPRPQQRHQAHAVQTLHTGPGPGIRTTVTEVIL